MAIVVHETNRYYGPGATEIHPILRCDIILPDPALHPQPAGGYPYVIFNTGQAYVYEFEFNTNPAESTPQAMLLAEGIALVVPTYPVVRTEESNKAPGTDLLNTSTFDLTADPKLYGDMYEGNGVIPRMDGGIAGGKVWPGDALAGQVTHPWLNDDRINPWKAAQWVVQHCNYHGIGGDGVGQADYSQIPINAGLCWIFGSSSGAQTAMYTAMSGDKRLLASTYGWTGQDASSSRVRGLACFNVTYSFVSWRKDDAFDAVPNDPLDRAPEAYQMALAAGGDWDESAEDTKEAGTAIVAEHSALYFSKAFWFWPYVEGQNWAGLIAENAKLKIWASSNTAMNPDVLADKDRYAKPYGHVGKDDSGDTNAHSIYNLYLLKRDWPQAYTVANNGDHIDTEAEDLVWLNGTVQQIDEAIPDTTERYQSMVAAIKADLIDSQVVAPAEPLPNPTSYPILTGDYPLVGSQPKLTTTKEEVSVAMAGQELVSGALPLDAGNLPPKPFYESPGKGRVVQWQVRSETPGKRVERAGIRILVQHEGVDKRTEET